MRYLKHVLTLLFISLPLQIVGIFLLPFVLPFVPKDTEVLPRWLRWFDNNHSHLNLRENPTIIDGLAGWPEYRRVRGIYPQAPYNFFKLLWGRYVWLAWRNPTNYFAYAVLGFTWPERVYIVSQSGDLGIGDFTRPGSYKTVIRDLDRNEYWEYYLIYKYKHIPGRCFRLRMGYKIGDPRDGHNYVGRQIQWVFAPSPLHSYKGE